MSTSRAMTPPPQATAAAPPTPEQVKQMANNRLIAKARAMERDRANRQNSVQPSAATNSNAKRPMSPIPATSTGPSNLSTKHFERDSARPLKDNLGTYIEYDLAKMTDSYGGYLMVDQADDAKMVKDMELIEKNRNLRMESLKAQGLLHEPSLSTDMSLNKKCQHCKSINIDQTFSAVFHVLVCKACKDLRPDDYSLLTKTECKEDYLLTDPELKDAELLPHLLKPNPYRPTYSNMMLFLRIQVETFAFSAKKWGSAEALDEEFARRETEKKAKKGKKFEKKLKELRKSTKTNVWHKRVEGEHSHEFVVGVNEEGLEVQRCETCDYSVEVETF